MNELLARLDPRPPARVVTFALAVLACAGAVLFGLAAGDRTALTLLPAGILGGLAVVAIAMVRPFVGFMGIAASMFLLIVVIVPGSRVNPLDLLLPPILVAVLFGTARDEAKERDAWETGERHESIQRARRRFARAAVAYFGIAALSIGLMVGTGRSADATRSLFALTRGFQGLLLFPLGLWLLRGEKRIYQTMAATFVATILLLVVNLYAQTREIQRAGISWWVNNPEWPVADPNEAATAMVVVVAFLMARQAARAGWRNYVLAVPALVVLLMTYSRSGLLAMLAFGTLAFRKARWRWLALGAVGLAAVVVPLVSPEYATRIVNTLIMKQNSFEAFTSILRFYAWKTAVTVFRTHPLFGVGYLGLLPISNAYNDLRVHIGAESYILEIAADLGIVGLAAFTVLVVQLFRLGSAVRRATPQGSLGHQMAVLHAPLVIGLLIASLTGTTFIGMVGLGQLAVWTAMMVRAGHEAVGLAPSSASPSAASQ